MKCYYRYSTHPPVGKYIKCYKTFPIIFFIKISEFTNIQEIAEKKKYFSKFSNFGYTIVYLEIVFRKFSTMFAWIFQSCGSYYIECPSVPHQKPLSSAQFLFEGCVEQWSFWCETERAEQRGFWSGTEGFSVWNWGVCWTEGFMMLNRGFFGVELRDLSCGTEGSFVWNWGVCWTEVFLLWNWGIFGAEKEWPFCVELRGTPLY